MLTEEKANLLLIADRPEDLSRFENILRDLPCEFFTASSGEEAQQLIAQHDFVLTLWSLQTAEMRGFEMAALIQGTEQGRNLPLIFVTARNDTPLAPFEGQTSGVIDYLFEPVEPIILRSKVQVLLDLDQKTRLLHEHQLTLTQTTIALAQEKRQRQLAEAERDAMQTALAQARDYVRAAEKMAALGKLLADVMHDLNNPLSAIRGAIGNLAQGLNVSLRQLPALFQQLSDDVIPLFFALLDRTLDTRREISTREERQLKKTLLTELTAHQIKDAEILADTLVDMGVTENLRPLLPLFQQKNAPFILEIAYNLSLQHQNSQTIIRAVERTAKIIWAVKAYAAPPGARQDRKTPVNIQEGLEAVLTLYHSQLRQGLDVQTSYAQTAELLGYPDELNQVWRHLLQNAMQAMAGKGTLTIAVRQDAAVVVVEFTDSGCGIPAELRARIFEPFFTTQPAGAGLGLDICRQIVAKHQGTLTFESQPGRTTFQVRLPLTLANQGLTAL